MATCSSDKADLECADPIIVSVWNEKTGRDGSVGQRPAGSSGAPRGGICAGRGTDRGERVLMLECESCDC